MVRYLLTGHSLYIYRITLEVYGWYGSEYNTARDNNGELSSSTTPNIIYVSYSSNVATFKAASKSLPFSFGVEVVETVTVAPPEEQDPVILIAVVCGVVVAGLCIVLTIVLVCVLKLRKRNEPRPKRFVQATCGIIGQMFHACMVNLPNDMHVQDLANMSYFGILVFTCTLAHVYNSNIVHANQMRIFYYTATLSHHRQRKPSDLYLRERKEPRSRRQKSRRGSYEDLALTPRGGSDLAYETMYDDDDIIDSEQTMPWFDPKYLATDEVYPADIYREWCFWHLII